MFVITAAIGLYLWFILSYGQFKIVDLSVDRQKALLTAQSYLISMGVNPKGFLKAVIFSSDYWSDRYLQKTLGSKAAEDFTAKHGFEMFHWNVRFFKKLDKEEYKINISPKSGEVIGFEHLIEDTAYRRTISREDARKQAEDFLKKSFGIDIKEYNFFEEQVKRYDRRTDYAFSWERKGVYVPWGNNEGGAKLLIGATLAGDSIKSFYKMRLDIPEKFRRYIEKQNGFGQYLSTISFLATMFLILWAIFILVKKRADVISRVCKRWYVYLFVFFLSINIIEVFNNLQFLFFSYNTSVQLSSFLGINLIKIMISLLIMSVSFMLPGIAGESLRFEAFPLSMRSSFSHYLRSSFFTRGVTFSILLGYLLFAIFLGLQSVLFYFGQKYLGVWKEWINLAQLSSSYLPFCGAFVMGFSASLNEEIIFRLFGISCIKKHTKNTALAIVLTSLIWGLGHSAYPVFPVWFRAIEVSIMGFLYGAMFVKYGLIPLLVAHYLFDVFWGTAAYILGRSTAYLTISSCIILILPFAFGMLSYIMNQSEEERELKVALDPIQSYNLGILKIFVEAKKSQGLSIDALKSELIKYNWDPVLIELSIKDIFKT